MFDNIFQLLKEIVGISRLMYRSINILVCIHCKISLKLFIGFYYKKLIKIMGDFLTRPITEKNPTDGKDYRMKFGACSMQGWRKSNEDAHTHILDLGDGNSLFAVFDGHGGKFVAIFCD